MTSGGRYLVKERLLRMEAKQTLSQARQEGTTEHQNCENQSR